jgi:hypothetical protein
MIGSYILSLQSPTMRRAEYARLKRADPSMHNLVRAFVEEEQRRAGNMGREQVLAQMYPPKTAGVVAARLIADWQDYTCTLAGVAPPQYDSL